MNKNKKFYNINNIKGKVIKLNKVLIIIQFDVNL